MSVTLDKRNTYYVVEVFGGIEPELHGPYESEDTRQAVAVAVHSKSDPETDATFWLDVALVNGKPIVDIGSYDASYFADKGVL